MQRLFGPMMTAWPGGAKGEYAAVRRGSRRPMRAPALKGWASAAWWWNVHQVLRTRGGVPWPAALSIGAPPRRAAVIMRGPVVNLSRCAKAADAARRGAGVGRGRRAAGCSAHRPW